MFPSNQALLHASLAQGYVSAQIQFSAGHFCGRRAGRGLLVWRLHLNNYFDLPLACQCVTNSRLLECVIKVGRGPKCETFAWHHLWMAPCALVNPYRGGNNAGPASNVELISVSEMKRAYCHWSPHTWFIPIEVPTLFYCKWLQKPTNQNTFCNHKRLQRDTNAETTKSIDNSPQKETKQHKGEFIFILYRNRTTICLNWTTKGYKLSGMIHSTR